MLTAGYLYYKDLFPAYPLSYMAFVKASHPLQSSHSAVSSQRESGLKMPQSLPENSAAFRGALRHACVSVRHASLQHVSPLALSRPRSALRLQDFENPGRQSRNGSHQRRTFQARRNQGAGLFRVQKRSSAGEERTSARQGT